MTITFHKQTEIPDEQLKFAVIAAQYNGKWIFCRHKQRTTWEIPGGHCEPSENILDTARRELYEETGAIDFDIKPICVYKFNAYGLLCYAEVKTLGELPPEMEIDEIKQFDTLPDELTYPAIQPELFRCIQGWLNLQSNPDELWDVYDDSRNLTGRTHRRGDWLADGEYHLVVQVWIQNSNGEFLLTKRTPNKGYPNMWENTGGSALVGDDSLTAALREANEETGLTLALENGKLIITLKHDDAFVDIWLFRADFELSDVILQENETCDAMLADKAKILWMREQGLLVPMSYLDDFFGKVSEPNETV